MKKFSSDLRIPPAAGVILYKFPNILRRRMYTQSGKLFCYRAGGKPPRIPCVKNHVLVRQQDAFSGAAPDLSTRGGRTAETDGI